MTVINILILISLCFTLFYLFGVFVFITDHVENKCEMTYMFQYPQFVKISMNTYPKYRKYGLYAYSEGRFTEKTRNMQFEGIPVLFVPGNAGSYKQVRSLASVALRKALSDRPGFHFDYFTVDLNEELSGINGALLDDQMNYVNYSIGRILDLYKNSTRPPKSVVLIGHSMGGIILKSLISTFPENSELAPLLITLATPHKRPPAIFDKYMSNFYQKTMEESVTSNKTTIISVAGGYNDFLVPSYLSNLNDEHNLYAVSTIVPRVWLPTDHLCILWCKQLILTINRALFDSVDLRTKQFPINPMRYKAIFYHHLVHNSGIKIKLAERYNEPILNIDNRGDWIEHFYRQYSVELINNRPTQWYMIRYHELPQHETVTILALNMDNEDWVFACPAIYVRGQSRICNDGIHLSHISTMVPSLLHKRRMIDVNMHELKKTYNQLTHVVVKALPDDDPVILHVDVYDSKQRTLNVSLPHILSFSKHIIIPQTDEKALRYNLLLPELQQIKQSYKLYLEPISCSRTHHHASASFSVPWANEGSHVYVTEDIVEILHLRLYSSPPNTNQSAIIKLTLDPNCRYQVSIRSSLVGTLGQLARFYSSFLIAHIAVIILMVLRHQLKTANTENKCNYFLIAIGESSKPSSVIPFVKMITFLLSFETMTKLFSTSDWSIIKNEGLDFLILPLLLHLCSVGIIWIIALALSVAIIISESTIQRFALTFLARSFTGTLVFSDYLLSALQKLPIAVALGLIILCFCTCGGLALCVGVVFYFLKLTHMSQEFVEQLVWTLVKKSALCVKNFFRKQKTTSENQNENKGIQEVKELTETSETAETKEKNESSEEENTEQTGEERGNVDADSENEVKNEETDMPEKQDKIKAEENINSKEELCNDKVPVKQEINDIDTSIFFHFTLFLLWSLVAALCIPSVLTWAHNFRYNTRLVPDPSFWPGLILCCCAIPLWQLDLPKFNKKWYQFTSEIIYVVAITILVYAIISLYRLTYLLTFSIVVVTLHQLFAPNAKENKVTDDSKETTYIEKVKAKLE